jgi:hypothetical protein
MMVVDDDDDDHDYDGDNDYGFVDYNNNFPHHTIYI